MVNGQDFAKLTGGLDNVEYGIYLIINFTIHKAPRHRLRLFT